MPKLTGPSTSVRPTAEWPDAGASPRGNGAKHPTASCSQTTYAARGRKLMYLYGVPVPGTWLWWPVADGVRVGCVVGEWSKTLAVSSEPAGDELAPPWVRAGRRAMNRARVRQESADMRRASYGLGTPDVAFDILGTAKGNPAARGDASRPSVTGLGGAGGFSVSIE